MKNENRLIKIEVTDETQYSVFHSQIGLLHCNCLINLAKLVALKKKIIYFEFVKYHQSNFMKDEARQEEVSF